MRIKLKNIFKKMKYNKKCNIFKRILFPLLFIIFFEVLIFFAFIFFSGILYRMEENTYSAFNNIIKVRAKEIEYKMKKEWGNLNFYSERINDDYEKFLQTNNIKSLNSNSSTEIKFLSQISRYLMDIMRANSVNGAYIILCRDDDKENEKDIERNAIALCDLDPNVGKKGNKDIITVISSFSVAEKMDNILSNNWSARYKLKKSDDFYFNPIKTAYEYPDTYDSLGYWKFDHTMPCTNIKAISYSIPLKDKSGKVYAVLGVEIANFYISTLMPYFEILHNSKAAYFFGFYNKEKDAYIKISDSGYLYKDILENAKCLKLKPSAKFKNIKHVKFCSEFNSENNIIAGLSKINLSDDKIQFVDNELIILGLAAKRDLFIFFDNIFLIFILIVIFCVVAGIFGIFFATKLISFPISKLSKEITAYSPSKHQDLKYTGIMEIDRLIQSIESLSIRIYESQENFSRILKMNKLPVGAFEYNIFYDEMFFTDTFFEILEVPEEKKCEIKNISDYESFINRINKYVYSKEDDNTLVYRIPDTKGRFRFVRYHYISSKKGKLGTVIDITQDMKEKEKIEHDRDTDILTQLFNRRAFMANLETFFKAPSINQKAVIIMMDVDKLKYVNDNFGHKYGDKLIQEVAENLHSFSNAVTIPARLSGDEFIIFSYAFKNMDEIEKKLIDIRKKIKNSKVDLPNGQKHDISVSGGYAVYPDDSEDYHQLLQYADMAMYKMKREKRGAFVRYSEDCNLR